MSADLEGLLLSMLSGFTLHHIPPLVLNFLLRLRPQRSLKRLVKIQESLMVEC